jgi:DNA invertase Pin-like site-specific DNA recombinase
MRAVIYARISTDKQSEGSIEQQIRKCEEYCAYRDYIVVKVYQDVGTGKTIDRPGFVEMMATMDDWDICIAHKLDRMHRNAANAARWATQLDSAKKDFSYVDMDVDTATAMGRFVYRLMNDLAQLEVEQTSERTKMGLQAVINQGRKTGPPPYGYDSKFAKTGNAADRGLLLVNKEEAAIVKVIYECHEKGYSGNKIVEHLVSNKIKTKKKKSVWKQSTISSILKKGNFYKGLYLDDQSEWVTGKWVAIL